MATRLIGHKKPQTLTQFIIVKKMQCYLRRKGIKEWLNNIRKDLGKANG